MLLRKLSRMRRTSERTTSLAGLLDKHLCVIGRSVAHVGYHFGGVAYSAITVTCKPHHLDTIHHNTP